MHPMGVKILQRLVYLRNRPIKPIYWVRLQLNMSYSIKKSLSFAPPKKKIAQILSMLAATF